MTLTEFLADEWKLALGCTEPAAIALAAAHAASLGSGPVKAVHLVCDPRIYKNCHAVGIPNSNHKVGILWAIALGAVIPGPDAGLESFRLVTPDLIAEAKRLLDSGAVTVEIDASRRQLHIDCRVVRAEGTGRAVIEVEHTRLTRLERDGQEVPLAETRSSAPSHPGRSPRQEVAELPLQSLLDLARTVGPSDRQRLQEGARLNLAISDHGLGLLPGPGARLGAQPGDRPGAQIDGLDVLTLINRLVCAGVYARMSGEDLSVMSLAGSGNKGIVIGVSVPLFGRALGKDQEEIDTAMAFACLVTSATTWHLGTLSAVCGCTNAAGIGLAAALVLLQGGGARELSLAVNNMVGNIAGMICDGAKMGCAMKTMTAVDAAYRAAQLAIGQIGIPASDGIVGRSGEESLRFLGRIANAGMAAMDEQILQIMQSKLRRAEG